IPLDHVRRFTVRRNDEYMHLDGATIRNLELLKPFGSNETSSSSGPTTLLDVLDRTATAMGTRLLRQWLVRPLLSYDQIRLRLDAVDELKNHMQVRGALRTALREIQDIARLGSRIVLGLAGPRELLALNQSLSVLPEIVVHLASLHSQLLCNVRAS